MALSWKPGPEELEGIATILRADPLSYLAFGPYWWWVKKWLQEAYGENTPIQGNADDPITRLRLAQYWKRNGKALWKAAINHFEQKTAWGERYDPHSYMPPWEDGYILHDPDMGVA